MMELIEQCTLEYEEKAPLRTHKFATKRSLEQAHKAKVKGIQKLVVKRFNEFMKEDAE